MAIAMLSSIFFIIDAPVHNPKIGFDHLQNHQICFCICICKTQLIPSQFGAAIVIMEFIKKHDKQIAVLMDSSHV